MRKNHRKGSLQIIKAAIDEWNPYGLLPDAPKDEFDRESKAVAARITSDSSVAEIAKVISTVFSSSFEAKYFESSACLQVAEKIKIGLTK